MSLINVASKIPAEYRKEILELNLISNAVAVGTDPTMHYLGVIWKNYIDPNYAGDCPLCYGRLLDNYRALLPLLIDLEKQSKLLDEA